MIRVPRPLRAHTDGLSQVDVDGSDVRSALADLVRVHPALQERLLDPDGELRRFVNVFVGDDDIRHLDGLDTVVEEHDTVTLVPAVAGGAD